jgi:hypothetical protein
MESDSREFGAHLHAFPATVFIASRNRTRPNLKLTLL